ncbi:MAG: hydroxyacid dehydrogenase [Pseudobdellovibrionaceae bacterium]
MAAKQSLVLITDRFSTEAWVRLETTSFLRIEKAAEPTLEKADLSEVAGLIIRSRTKINAALLKRAPKLQVIVTTTSGFDHIDLAATEAHGVTVMFTPEANVQSAMELTWALVLAGSRKVVGAHKAVKAGDWNRDLLLGNELEGKTYGIIGFGRIGKRVAQLAHAFGMKTIAFDPYLDEDEFFKFKTPRVSLEELLRTSDVISIHVPLTAETKGMFNSSRFECIRNGVILVNTSRGLVISEQDLITALKKGWIGACGLDVFEKEPLPRDSQLLNFQNVILTPHVGANTEEAFLKASMFAAQKTIQFFHDGTASDTLPPKAAWYGAEPFKSSH